MNKFIAESGLCSRREADRLIEAGHVTINGKKATLGDRVLDGDAVAVNGKPLARETSKIYIAFHKPYGVITTTDKNSDNTVMDYVDVGTRVYPIGRLDVQSSGLLLLTNDGEIVNSILKSENKLEKEYMVTVDKPLQERDLRQFREGVILDERKTLPAHVEQINSHQMSLTLIQGMNRQIRRMCEMMGYEVKILKRVRIGTILLDELPRGKWRHLTKKELDENISPLPLHHAVQGLPKGSD